jgi:hypothetical protein
MNSKIVDIDSCDPTQKYECIRLDLDDKHFIYENYIVKENIDIDCEYYIINKITNKKLLKDMSETNRIKFEFSDKMITTNDFLYSYMSYSKLCCKYMPLDDYLHLDDLNVSKKYEGKYLIIDDELPHMDNLNYIEDQPGYEIKLVHLKSEPEKNNERRRIYKYIIDE